MKLSEVNNINQSDTMVECRTTVQEVPTSNLSAGKKKFSPVQSKQHPQQTLGTRVKCLKLSDVKTRGHYRTKVQWRTRDPEIPNSNTDVAKSKILIVLIRTITQPKPPHLKYIPEIIRSENQKSLWHNSRVQDFSSRGPHLNPKAGKKKKNLTSPIRTTSPPNPLHQS